MFAHDGHGAATDLSYWLGPLSPAFRAMAASASARPAAPQPESQAGTPGESNEAPELLGAEGGAPESPAELRTLFHALNNQLGVILTYAELLEAKASDDGQRARAAQIVSATIEALGTSRQIRHSVVK
jgi:hypothetical protein